MSGPELNRRALSVFDEVCDLPPDQRARVIAQRCAGDDTLRARVESLLAHDSNEQAPIPDAEFGAGAQVLADELVTAAPSRIGRYRILREVGRGGMGVVYEAEQDNPRRRVALKVIRQGFVSRQTLRRFEHEANVLAQLDHPGIAHIYEAGAAPIGNSAWPFFAMEFIEGRPLDAHARERHLSVRDTLELVARVCDAVQHAHQRGVIHRDLKPGNILVKEQVTAADAASTGSATDAIGQPKILDFGIARVTDSDLQASTLQTGAGQILGTLAYMSPEQLDGAAQAIDTRCDVYAIGVILYQLLSGHLPHALAGKPVAEAARILREDEPRRLSAIAPALKGDIETIVAKAIEKDRERRYRSAAELAEDIRRHLRDDPVAAHPPGALYQLRKFARRNRALVAGAAAAVVALIIGLVATSWALVQASRERDAAELARRRSQEVADFQRRLLTSLDPAQVGDAIEAELLREYETGASPHDLDAFRAALDDINETNLGRSILHQAIALNAARLADHDFTDDPLAEAEIRVGVGEVMYELGQYADAATQFRAALGLREAAAPDDRASILRDRLRLAKGLVSARQFEEAESILITAHADAEKRLGPDSDAALDATRRLSQVYRETARTDEAIELQTRLLAIARARGDKELLARSLNELGVCMIDERRTNDAIECFQECLALTDEDPDLIPRGNVLNTVNNLMAALFRANRLDEAEHQARKAIPLFNAEHGDEHPSAIMARNNHARVLLDLGRTDEALFILRAEQDLCTRVLRPTSNVRAAVTTNLIEALLWEGRPAEAEAPARALLATRRAADPPRAPAIAQTLEQLGQCLEAMQRYPEAESAFRECVTLRESVDPDHWLTHRARGELGAAIGAQGRAAEAEPLLLESAEAIERLQSNITPNMRPRELAAAAERIERFYAGQGTTDRTRR